MDRNCCREQRGLKGTYVALRKESVDRNGNGGADTGVAAVALRKESVDRNALHCRVGA